MQHGSLPGGHTGEVRQGPGGGRRDPCARDGNVGKSSEPVFVEKYVSCRSLGITNSIEKLDPAMFREAAKKGSIPTGDHREGEHQAHTLYFRTICYSEGKHKHSLPE